MWTIRWEHLRKVSERLLPRFGPRGCRRRTSERWPRHFATDRLDDVPLVCRSSSSFEDSDQAAFPGVFHTTLDVCNREQLKDAIVVSYSSLFEMRALKYLLSRRPTDA